MHELSIAQNIVDILKDSVPISEGQSLKNVKLRIGEHAGVVSESLQFCFSVINESTPLEGVVLEIESVPFVVQCEGCGRQSTNEFGILRCACCDGTNVKMISGNEMEITSVEVLDEEEMRR